MLKISFTHDPHTLDPRKGSDPVASTVHFTLFEGLTRMNEQSTHEPSVAKSIEVTDDGLIYTFHLRKAHWSNGDPVIAEDFAYAWRTILDPNFPAPNAHLLFPIKNAEKVKNGEKDSCSLGIDTLDDMTLQITLERPTPYFTDLTSFCVLFPVPSKIAKRNPRWADTLGTDFVTNGAYVLDEWKLSNQLVFKKNDHFWDRDHVKLDKISAVIIDNETTALGMFEQGELDFMGSFLANIQTEWIPELKKKYQLDYRPLGATKFTTFNTQNFPFNNVNIRKAFAYAIDRQSLVNDVTQSEEEPAYGFVAPIMKGGLTRTFLEEASQQKAQAYLQKGLEELGLKNASELGELRYDYYTNVMEKRLAQALQQQWVKTLGVNVRLNESEFNVMMERLNKHNYQFGQFMYVAQYNDVMNILDRFKIQSNLKNYPVWENPEYIRLLEDSAYVQDRQKRLEVLEKAEAIMAEEMPLAPIYHWGNLTITHPRVHNFFISPVGSIHLMYTWVDKN